MLLEDKRSTYGCLRRRYGFDRLLKLLRGCLLAIITIGATFYVSVDSSLAQYESGDPYHGFYGPNLPSYSLGSLLGTGYQDHADFSSLQDLRDRMSGLGYSEAEIEELLEQGRQMQSNAEHLDHQANSCGEIKAAPQTYAETDPYEEFLAKQSPFWRTWYAFWMPHGRGALDQFAEKWPFVPGGGRSGSVVGRRGRSGGSSSLGRRDPARPFGAGPLPRGRMSTNPPPRAPSRFGPIGLPGYVLPDTGGPARALTIPEYRFEPCTTQNEFHVLRNALTGIPGPPNFPSKSAMTRWKHANGPNAYWGAMFKGPDFRAANDFASRTGTEPGDWYLMKYRDTQFDLEYHFGYNPKNRYVILHYFKR